MTLFDYAVAPGHDNGGSVQIFEPQPASPAGIVHPEFVEAISGVTHADGAAYCDVYFKNLLPTEYLAILALHGLSTTDPSDVSQPVTIRLPGPDRTSFGTYNATVVHKRGQGDAEFEGHVYRSAHFRYRKLEVSA